MRNMACVLLMTYPVLVLQDGGQKCIPSDDFECEEVRKNFYNLAKHDIKYWMWLFQHQSCRGNNCPASLRVRLVSCERLILPLAHIPDGSVSSHLLLFIGIV